MDSELDYKTVPSPDVRSRFRKVKRKRVELRKGTRHRKEFSRCSRTQPCRICRESVRLGACEENRLLDYKGVRFFRRSIHTIASNFKTGKALIRCCVWLEPGDLELVERIADGWAKTPRGNQRVGHAISVLVQLGIDRLFEFEETQRSYSIKEILDEGLRIFKPTGGDHDRLRTPNRTTTKRNY